MWCSYSIFHTPHLVLIFNGLSYFSLSTFCVCICQGYQHVPVQGHNTGSYDKSFKYIWAIRHLEPFLEDGGNGICLLSNYGNVLAKYFGNAEVQYKSFWTYWMLWSISSNANIETKTCKWCKKIFDSRISHLSFVLFKLLNSGFTTLLTLNPGLKAFIFKPGLSNSSHLAWQTQSNEAC